MKDGYLCGNFSAHNPKLEPLMLCLLKKKNSFTITKYFFTKPQIEIFLLVRRLSLYA